MENQIVIDKIKQELFVKTGKNTVETMACSTGMRSSTPKGLYKITDIYESSNLGWPKLTSSRKPYGPYTLEIKTLDGHDTNLAIHGTDEPKKLGFPVTHGCIRVSNNNIEKLTDKYVRVGTRVEVV